MSQSNIKLTQLEPCEHRVGKICPTLLENTNLSFHCYPAICNIFCPKTDGPRSPYFRRGSANLTELVLNRTNYLILVKAAGRGPVTYQLTKQAQRILEALQPYVPKGARLLLGGSVIHDQWSGNDVDVIIEFERLDEKAVEIWEKLRSSNLVIEDVAVDWMPRREGSPALFPVLDPDLKIVSGCPPLLHPESRGKGVDLIDSEHPIKPNLPHIISKFVHLVEKHYVPTSENTTLTPDGLGDVIAKAIKAVSFGKIEPCEGCEQRRQALNKLGQKMGIGVKS